MERANSDIKSVGGPKFYVNGGGIINPVKSMKFAELNLKNRGLNQVLQCGWVQS